MTPDYLGWVDTTKAKPVLQKLAEAIEAYRHKHGIPATLVLCSEEDVMHAEGVEIVAVEGVTVRAVGWLQRGCFRVGREAV